MNGHDNNVKPEGSLACKIYNIRLESATLDLQQKE